MADDIRLNVRVTPNAGGNQVTGFSDDILKIKLAAPPVEGKANLKLVEFLSDLLDIPKSHFQIIRGMSSRNKVLQISGITPGVLEKRIKGASKAP